MLLLYGIPRICRVTPSRHHWDLKWRYAALDDCPSWSQHLFVLVYPPRGPNLSPNETFFVRRACPSGVLPFMPFHERWRLLDWATLADLSPSDMAENEQEVGAEMENECKLTRKRRTRA